MIPILIVAAVVLACLLPDDETPELPNSNSEPDNSENVNKNISACKIDTVEKPVPESPPSSTEISVPSDPPDPSISE